MGPPHGTSQVDVGLSGDVEDSGLVQPLVEAIVKVRMRERIHVAVICDGQCVHTVLSYEVDMVLRIVQAIEGAETIVCV